MLFFGRPPQRFAWQALLTADLDIETAVYGVYHPDDAYRLLRLMAHLLYRSSPSNSMPVAAALLFIRRVEHLYRSLCSTLDHIPMAGESIVWLSPPGELPLVRASAVSRLADGCIRTVDADYVPPCDILAILTQQQALEFCR
jgi:hypothetical protein